MALAQLTDEQIRTWTREEKDRWWFENIYRGDLPQLTIRSAVTGFCLGGILSATNLYVAGKTGVTLGVNLTSVILAFAMFRILARVGLGKDFTILENNAMQSIATSAGYMTVPLTSSLAAYMMVTNTIVPVWHIVLWMTVMSLIGVLIAFPSNGASSTRISFRSRKAAPAGSSSTRFTTARPAKGFTRPNCSGITAGLTGLYQFIVSGGLQRLFQFKLLRMDKWLGRRAVAFPRTHRRVLLHAGGQVPSSDSEYSWDRLPDSWPPGRTGRRHARSRRLNGRPSGDQRDSRHGGQLSCARSHHDRSAATSRRASGLMGQPSRSAGWRLSPMVSLVGRNHDGGRSRSSLSVGKPEIFTSVVKNLRGKKKSKGKDILAGIELPLWISYVGVPVLSLLGTWLTHLFFGVPVGLALLSLPLVIILTVICVNSMALDLLDADQFPEQDHAILHRRDRSH